MLCTKHMIFTHCFTDMNLSVVIILSNYGKSWINNISNSKMPWAHVNVHVSVLLKVACLMIKLIANVLMHDGRREKLLGLRKLEEHFFPKLDFSSCLLICLLRLLCISVHEYRKECLSWAHMWKKWPTAMPSASSIMRRTAAATSSFFYAQQGRMISLSFDEKTTAAAVISWADRSCIIPHSVGLWNKDQALNRILAATELTWADIPGQQASLTRCPS